MTRYRQAFSWHGGIQQFLEQVVLEKPLLNACAGRTPWGDVTLDLYEPADVKGPWTDFSMFSDDEFGAVFADPPWDVNYKKEVSLYVKAALRVAPVAYLMAPWMYSAAWVDLTDVWYRQIPGVQTPVLLTRYARIR